MDGIRRNRLGSLEPRIITEEDFVRTAGGDSADLSFHLSLQSGCNETLKRMNRHYTAENAAKKARFSASILNILRLR